jgi:hypothetical protein
LLFMLFVANDILYDYWYYNFLKERVKPFQY